MTLSGLLLFVSVYVVAAAAPGPGVAAIVARVLARGRAGLGAFIAGFVIGELIWFGFAVTGLAMLAQQFHTLFLVVKYAGVAYLLWLAIGLLRAAEGDGTIGASRLPDGPGRLFLAGLAVTLGNPKVMVFFMAILPTVVDLTRLTPAETLELALLIACLLSLILAAYGLAAERARRFIASPRARKIANRACGATMIGAAAAIATR